MDEKRLVRISKLLSKILRHQPASVGLTLEPGGWVTVEELLGAVAQHHFPLNRTELEEVVAKNNKQRFAFDGGGTRIRASQGHSVEVDLEFEPVEPPAMLYHGTGHTSVAAILAEGLKKMRRHHVHLSADMATARNVGARHGRPVVFEVDAAAMQAAGQHFYCSANGVWLTDEVPARFLRVLDE